MREKWQNFCDWWYKRPSSYVIVGSGFFVTIYLFFVAKQPPLALWVCLVVLAGGVAMAWGLIGKDDPIPLDLTFRETELRVRSLSLPVPRLGLAIGLSLLTVVGFSFISLSAVGVFSAWVLFSILIGLRAYLLELRRRDQVRPKNPDQEKRDREDFAQEFYRWLDTQPEAPE